MQCDHTHTKPEVGPLKGGNAQTKAEAEKLRKNALQMPDVEQA